MMWHIVVFVSLSILASLYTSMLGAKSRIVASTGVVGTGEIGATAFFLPGALYFRFSISTIESLFNSI